jgi:hypothetical protein
MAEPDESPERYDLGYLLARASQRWDALLAERCRAHGFGEVRPAFGSILLPLFQSDGLRIGELATWARLSKQAMTTLVRDPSARLPGWTRLANLADGTGRGVSSRRRPSAANPHRQIQPVVAFGSGRAGTPKRR